jgi:aminoglycoside/choline kinase family phosphotransferase
MTDAANSAAESRADAFEYVAGRVASRWPGARATGLEPLRGDASSREYSRVRINAGTSGAPSSLIVMHLRDAAVALSSEELGVYGKGGPSELPFVNVWRYLRSLTDAVPDIYDVSPTSTLLLLEDVGDVTLFAAAEAGGAAGLDLFRGALRLIADLQVRARDDGRCYAFRQSFDERLFAWEFEHFVEFGLRDPAPSLLADVRRELRAAAHQLAGLERVFCHRDFHGWNLHVQPGGRIRVIDFQDALLAPRLYDVASLLTDRTTPRLVSPADERRLLLEFSELCGGLSQWRDEAALLSEYRTVALQRALKVVGRFNYLAEVKGKPGYLAMLPAAAATASRLLAELETMPATLAALQRFGKVGPSSGTGA